MEWRWAGEICPLCRCDVQVAVDEIGRIYRCCNVTCAYRDWAPPRQQEFKAPPGREQTVLDGRRVMVRVARPSGVVRTAKRAEDTVRPTLAKAGKALR